MAEMQYSPACSCGAPLKIFKASGRIAKACKPEHYPKDLSSHPRAAAKTWACLECGAEVWPYAKRCVACSHVAQRNRGNSFACEHCGKQAHRKSGGANKKKNYKSRWCSMQCKAAWSKEHPVARLCGVWFRACSQCERSFTARREKQKMCSIQCIVESKRYRPKRKLCVVCSTSFEGRGQRKYCSKLCYPKQKRKRKIATQRRNERRIEKGRRRALLAGVHHEPVNPIKVLERDGWHCRICGKETPRDRRGTNYPNAPEVDHRVPLARGGPHTYANLQCACRACNSWKGSKLILGQQPLFINGLGA